MIEFDEETEIAILHIRVIPRASKTEIVGVHDGAVKIKLKAPPVDGAANEELIRFLSKSLDTPRSNFEIVSGQTSRIKRVRINGFSAIEIDRFLQGKS